MDKIEKILERTEKRNYFYMLLTKLVGCCMSRGIRLVIENPFSGIGYLHNNWLKDPDFIDKNRMLRGDYFMKPTAYWFFNCEQTFGETIQMDKPKRKIRETKSASEAGLCSEDRSMISPDYARNFICDKIIGIPQKFTQLSLFDNI